MKTNYTDAIIRLDWYCRSDHHHLLLFASLQISATCDSRHNMLLAQIRLTSSNLIVISRKWEFELASSIKTSCRSKGNHRDTQRLILVDICS